MYALKNVEFYCFYEKLGLVSNIIVLYHLTLYRVDSHYPTALLLSVVHATMGCVDEDLLEVDCGFLCKFVSWGTNWLFWGPLRKGSCMR